MSPINTSPISPKRFVFIDAMRLFAVFMMVQGHTVYAFLDDSYRTVDNIGYGVWRIMRGYTAPMFLFITGCIFTFLLFKQQHNTSVSRINKGIKRAFLLIIIGYLLRTPSFYHLFTGQLSKTAIQNWLKADVLQLIGIGMLICILLFKIGRKISSPLYLYIFTCSIILVMNYFIQNTNFSRNLPFGLATYINEASGSQFPIFPWLFYIIGGSTVGYWLYSLDLKNNTISTQRTLYFYIIFIGLSLLLMVEAGEYVTTSITHVNLYWKGNPLGIQSIGLDIHRLGVVIIISGVLGLIFKQITLPKWCTLVAKNTLWIYVGHLILIYHIAKPLQLPKTSFVMCLLYILIVFIFMISLVYIIEWLNSKKHSSASSSS